MRFRGFLCLLMLLAVFLPSRAGAGATQAKWLFVGFTKYRDALFVDMNRMTSGADPRVQVWSRITPAEHSRYHQQIQRDLRNAGKTPRAFRYLETLNEMDCTSRQIRYLKVIYFRSDDSVIHATRDDRPLWKAVHPGSLWENLLTTVCRKQGGA